MKNSIHHRILAVLACGAACGTSHADNLIWSDNFDVPDSPSFDAAPLDNRRGGFFPTEVVGRSSRVQQRILSQQLVMGGGRVRFEKPPGGGTTIQSYDWLAGSAGAQILAGGGMRVEFDWVPTDNTAADWIAFSVGFPNFAIVPEPGGFRLNNDQTDFGFLLRNNGGVQYFKNSVSTTPTATFPATTTSRHVVITYGFTSVQELDPFTVRVSVDGTEVINSSSSWANNGNPGQLMIELETNKADSRIDNFQVFELTAPRLGVRIANNTFFSGVPAGSPAATLSALLGGVPGGATFQFVSGEGDTDNAKFQISGDQIVTGPYNFTGTGSTGGQTFSVRVRGTSTGAGGQTDERVLQITVLKDDDLDGLPDAWEIAKAGSITVLNGNGTADADGDGLTDLDEYQISIGTSTAYPGTFANINPTAADSDGDGLKDREELQPGYEITGNLRPATNPTLADTDNDGLNDFVETATQTYVSPTDTGTNPTVADTDGDGLNDGFEVENTAAGYSPLVDDGGLDTDGDGLTTADEVFYGSSVLLTDTDGDGLSDYEEIYPTGMRVVTHPGRADTDFDGLNDFVETNSGTFVGPNDTGTDPTRADTDGDFIRDGVELAAGTDLFDPASKPGLPAGFSVSRVTDEASTGISNSKVYTHAISGGGDATINGVVFSVLTGTQRPANFTWTSVTELGQPGSFDAINDNLGGVWVPATGEVSGTGLLALFDSFTYSANSAVGGSKQTYTLTGLAPGQAYELRLYVRPWDSSDAFTGRPIDYKFVNGSQSATPFQALPIDRPDVVLGTDNRHQAFALTYTYVAEGTSLVIEAPVPLTNVALPTSGSSHFYGLTNEAVGAAPEVLAITGVARDAGGNITIQFKGAANKTYRVTRSPDLTTPFVALVPNLPATTNAAGVGQAVVPAAEASERREFYRIQD